jgi:hypothetical protein
VGFPAAAPHSAPAPKYTSSGIELNPVPRDPRPRQRNHDDDQNRQQDCQIAGHVVVPISLTASLGSQQRRYRQTEKNGTML